MQAEAQAEMAASHIMSEREVRNEFAARVTHVLLGGCFVMLNTSAHRYRAAQWSEVQQWT